MSTADRPSKRGHPTGLGELGRLLSLISVSRPLRFPRERFTMSAQVQVTQVSKVFMLTPFFIRLQRSWRSTLTLMLSAFLFSGCVVKEELNDTYNQAHLGINEWSLLQTDSTYLLKLDIGYLIGLIDEEGVKAIEWRYELMTVDEEVLANNLEEMRSPSPEKKQVFVEGRRERELSVATQLTEGETYVLWFTLFYQGEILHEQLFAVVAGEEGGDPNWLEELIGERLGDNVDPSDLTIQEMGNEESGDLPSDMTEMAEAPENSPQID